MTKVRLSSGRSVTAYIPGIGALVLFTPRGQAGEMGSPISIFGGLGIGRKAGEREWVCLVGMKTYAEILYYHQ